MSVNACAEIVRKGDPDRFLATMTAPPDKRGDLFVLYAFNLEIARAPFVTDEPLIAEMRLQFWLDTLEEAADGKPARAHEVAAPLAELVQKRQIPTARLLEMVTARRFDIYKEPHVSSKHFDAYIADTSGNLMVEAARILDAGKSAEPIIAAFGHATGIAALLRGYSALKAKGRTPIVLDTPDAIVAIAKRALAGLVAARAKAKLVPKSCAPALRAGWQADAALRIAAKEPDAVLEGKLAPSEFHRRARLLWLTSTGRW